MWNNLLKFTLVSWLWKRYRRTIIAFPLLLLYFWLVNLIHSDVIAYASLNDNKAWLGWTFLIKWLCIFAGMIVFIFIHVAGQKYSNASNMLKQKIQANSTSMDDGDAFAAIRKKDKLRTRAEAILEKKK